MSKLVDKVFLEVRAGHGGAGALAYAAHKLKKLLGPGLPCGGNGGRGGDVSIVARGGVRSLGSIKPTVVAGNGSSGGKNRASGSCGISQVLQVPVGVTVTDVLGKGGVLADLNTDGQSVVVALGGVGGKGNNRGSPHERTLGQPGFSAKLLLELKTIADIGLVGFPNAGKSSLLALVSRASPKVAAYPFTTLSPSVGVTDTGVSVADIPGLVEQAHLNRGMGHEFLRHIVRTKALLFVVDSTGAHWDTRSPGSARTAGSTLSVLRSELALFDPSLTEKPWAVVCNKMDLEADQHVEQRLREADSLETELTGEPGFRGVVAVSAKFGMGKSTLVGLISDLMK